MDEAEFTHRPKQALAPPTSIDALVAEFRDVSVQAMKLRRERGRRADALAQLDDDIAKIESTLHHYREEIARLLELAGVLSHETDVRSGPRTDLAAGPDRPGEPGGHPETSPDRGEILRQ